MAFPFGKGFPSLSSTSYVEPNSESVYPERWDRLLLVSSVFIKLVMVGYIKYFPFYLCRNSVGSLNVSGGKTGIMFGPLRTLVFGGNFWGIPIYKIVCFLRTSRSLVRAG